jgi:hypothetical protein
MKHLLFPVLLLVLLNACTKDKPPVEPPGPEDPVDTVAVFVPVFFPGDTSLGAGYALKLGNPWAATADCRVQSHFDTNFIGITFFTYNQYNEQRESMGFSFIPRFGGEGQYGLKKMKGSALVPGYVAPAYGKWTADGDLLEDYYLLDTTATDNHFTVTKLDLINKRIECSFTTTFNILEPGHAHNPKRVKFSAGRAWAVIQQ